MNSLSFEIKARCSDPGRIRKVLLARGASFKGLDRQIDTYFRIPSGRLKLREGNIENALIYYRRGDQKRSKQCDAMIFPCKKKTPLKELLTAALGILAVVKKKRAIYFIQNIKFHIDRVKRLGNFVEIEVFARKGSPVAAKLRKQSEFYQRLLGIRAEELVADSYSDQLIRLETRDRRLKLKTKI